MKRVLPGIHLKEKTGDARDYAVFEVAKKLQKEWMEIHNDWKTPVWAYFRDRSERILDGEENIN